MGELPVFPEPQRPVLDSNSKDINDENALLPETSHEVEGRDIPLPDELRSILSTLKFDSSTIHVTSFSEFSDEIFKKVQLIIGKRFLYISRKDVSDPEFTRDYTIPLQVARLEIGQGGSVVGIVIDDENLAIETFSLLVACPFFKKVTDNFNISIEDIPDTSAYIEASNRVATERNTEALEIFALRDSGKSFRSDMNEPSREQAVDVMQGGTSFINRESPEQYIQTIGAGPCIVVVGYDSASETVGIVHADAFTDIIGASKEIVARAGEKIVVLGGQPESVAQLAKLKKYFDENSIVVSEWDIMDETKSIVVDKKTGEIYNLRNIVPKS